MTATYAVMAAIQIPLFAAASSSSLTTDAIRARGRDNRPGSR